jgi:MFS family permease
MSDTINLSAKTPGKAEGSLLVLGSSLTIMGAVMVAPMLPKMAAEFGSSGSSGPQAEMLVPLAVTGPALAIAIVAPLAGWVADRAGRKNLLIIATFVYALLGFLPAILTDLGSIVFSRLLFGCAEAAIMTCCTTLIADYWHGEERLKFVNYQVVSIGLIGSIFFVIGGVLGEGSWRTPFYLYLLPLVLTPFMIKVLWEPVKKANEGLRPVVDSNEKVAKLPLIIGYAMILGGMVLNFIVPIQTPSLLVDMGVVSTTKIGMSAGLGLLATLIGSLSWPQLRRRIGIPACNAVLLALLATGLWLLSSASSYENVLVAVTIHGIGAGLLVPNVMAEVMHALPKSVRGRGIGGFTSCLYLGQFISPIIVGVVIAASASDLRGAILSLAVMSLAAAALWLLDTLFIRGPRAKAEALS